jgi:hypothetical protein
MAYFTVVDANNKIYHSRCTEDPNYPVASELGFRLLPDNGPENYYPEKYNYIRIEPVPADATKIEYQAVERVYSQEQLYDTIKDARFKLLLATDWTQLPDSQLSTEQKQMFIEYRQQLRDIPEQPGYPFEVIWPERPRFKDTI